MLSIKLGSSATRAGASCSRGIVRHMCSDNVRNVTAATASSDVMSAPARAYADYCVYKGKGAMSIKPIPPSWSAARSQNGVEGLEVKREGVLLLEFAASGQGQGSQSDYGARNYAWDQKLTIALKPHEICQITDLYHPASGGRPVEVFHDPNKGTPEEGTQRKTLKVQFGQNNDASLLFQLNVASRNGPSRSITVPVTRAEFLVFKSIADYSIPRLLGLDYVFDNEGNDPATKATRQ